MVAAKHIAAVAVLGCLEGCLPVKTLVHNFADLDDHRIFANRPVAPPAKASHLRRAAAPGVPLERFSVPNGHGTHMPLEDYLDETRTVAFVVLRGDQIVYERYARGYDARSLLKSFSIAKAIVATLVGIAVAEGRIPSLGVRVGDFRPELAGSPYGAVRLNSLLTMTSGMADAPAVVPGRAQYYYSEDLHETVSFATQRLPINGERTSRCSAMYLRSLWARACPCISRRSSGCHWAWRPAHSGPWTGKAEWRRRSAALTPAPATSPASACSTPAADAGRASRSSRRTGPRSRHCPRSRRAADTSIAISGGCRRARSETSTLTVTKDSISKSIRDAAW